MKKLDMKSRDIVEEKISKISELFPNCISEGKIDFDMLKQELSKDIIEDGKEKYQLTWVGKKEAIVNANTPCSKTLRPAKEKSVDFDNTKNIYIEGDNLEALKILQESYLNKIKCIYIDPPYNTGNDFIYNDNLKKEGYEELIESGQIDEVGNKLISNSQSNGRFHSDWLSMMYPRIKLARNLLTEDGIIFISIDDNEVDNLRKICDEIFGENNFIAEMPRKTTEHIRVLADYELQKLNDFVLVYSKNLNKVLINKKIVGEKKYEFEDERGKYTLKPFQNSGENGTRRARPNLYYPIYFNISDETLSLDYHVGDIEILPKKVKSEDGRWLWSREKFENDKRNLKYKNGTLYRKEYYDSNEDQAKYESYKNWLDVYQNRLGAKALNELSMGEYFDYSKPVELIKFLLTMAVNEGDIVLDFFSGSATTAQTVLEINSQKRLGIKYIMVQLNAKIACDTKSFKDGYKTICDIGEERIRRAGKKIKEDTNADIDYGFRVYKVDSSNMKDVYYAPTDLKQSQLNMFESNIKEDRTAEDLLTQVILDLGLTLDLKIEEKKILNNNVYFVETNSLVACFDNTIDINIIDEICKYNPLKIVFKESSFKTDSDKISMVERIKKMSSETEVNII